MRDEDGVESLSPSRENTDDDDDAYIKHYNIIQAQLHAAFTKYTPYVSMQLYCDGL